MQGGKYVTFERITILILFVTLLGTFYRYQRLQTPNVIPESKTRHLLDAIFYAAELEGRAFPLGKFANVSVPSDTFLNFKHPTVILLFSLSSCDLCLSTEIEFLKKLWNERKPVATFDLIAIAVDTTQRLATLRRYKKVKQLDFPLFGDPDKVIINWMPKGYFPLVLLIGQDRKIIRAHLPVVDDHLLVEKNYKVLNRLLLQ